MGLPQAKHYYTAAEYLALEEQAEYRSEYFEGEIFAMSGGSISHDRISGDLNRLLGNALIGRPCEALTSNMKVKIHNTSAYFYPDATVICGPPIFEDIKQHVITNPTVIIEVLSESTEAYDRGKKFLRYKQIPSVKEYVLISQMEPYVDVFHRETSGEWTLRTYEGLDAVMELRSVRISIPMSEIYRRVEF